MNDTAGKSDSAAPVHGMRSATTPQSAWLVLTFVSAGLWCTALLAILMRAIFRGQHPNSLHAFYTSCFMAVAFGAPVDALFSVVAIIAAKRRSEFIPRHALWGCFAACVLFSALIIQIVVIELAR